ncbi:MAG: acyltransferase family protein [Acidimicrobiales bacterium]
MPERRPFRADIDGLRAVAILLIVAFHAKLPFFDGGFVGVDVFFVISGYLITRNLLDESGATGRVRLLTFWSKRVRRLVPALALMVAVVLAASIVIMPIVDLRDIAKQGASAAVYVSNMLFARQSQSYFGADVELSPFLHTWSLGVEEQFYLVWPVIVAVVVAVMARSRHRRRVIAGVFAAIFVASFTLNLRLSGNGTWAFFGLPARAWEFAGAGLLAILLGSRVPRTVVLRWGLAGAGAAFIVVATLTFSGSTTYPGAAALLPVVGTMLLIAAGAGAGLRAVGLTTVLSTRSMGWIGRVSYSWYLWHWPFIILLVQATGHDETAIRLVAVVLSLPLAYLALRFVENPLRFRPRLIGSVRRTFVLGGVATVMALLVAGGTVLAAERKPTTTLDEQLLAVKDNFFPGCVWQQTPGGTRVCSALGVSATDLLLVVGDSHAAMWFNEIATVAADHGLRAVLLSASSCPGIDVAVQPGVGGTSIADCQKIHRDRPQVIDELKPKGEILVETSHYVVLDAGGATPDTATQAEIWRTALGSFVDSTSQAGVKAGVILDNPRLSESASVCIGRTRSIEACRTPRDQAMAPILPLRDAELDLTSSRGIPTVDPVPLLCSQARCLLQIDDQILFGDDNHLTNAATKLFAQQIDELIGQVAG